MPNPPLLDSGTKAYGAGVAIVPSLVARNFSLALRAVLGKIIYPGFGKIFLTLFPTRGRERYFALRINAFGNNEDRRAEFK